MALSTFYSMNGSFLFFSVVVVDDDVTCWYSFVEANNLVVVVVVITVCESSEKVGDKNDAAAIMLLCLWFDDKNCPFLFMGGNEKLEAHGCTCSSGWGDNKRRIAHDVVIIQILLINGRNVRWLVCVLVWR